MKTLDVVYLDEEVSVRDLTQTWMQEMFARNDGQEILKHKNCMYCIVCKEILPRGKIELHESPCILRKESPDEEQSKVVIKNVRRRILEICGYSKVVKETMSLATSLNPIYSNLSELSEDIMVMTSEFLTYVKFLYDQIDDQKEELCSVKTPGEIEGFLDQKDVTPLVEAITRTETEKASVLCGLSMQAVLAYESWCMNSLLSKSRLGIESRHWTSIRLVMKDNELVIKRDRSSVPCAHFIKNPALLFRYFSILKSCSITVRSNKKKHEIRFEIHAGKNRRRNFLQEIIEARTLRMEHVNENELRFAFACDPKKGFCNIYRTKTKGLKPYVFYYEGRAIGTVDMDRVSFPRLPVSSGKSFLVSGRIHTSL